jgi:hypothetical protein
MVYLTIAVMVVNHEQPGSMQSQSAQYGANRQAATELSRGLGRDHRMPQAVDWIDLLKAEGRGINITRNSAIRQFGSDGA